MIEFLTPERQAELKAKAADAIRDGLSDHGLMAIVDKVDKKCGGKRLRSYLTGLTDGACHAVYEQLAGARFFALLRKYDFKVGAAARRVKFFEALPQPTGTGRQCAKATPCQVFQFASIFGFYHKGKRLTKRVLLFVPRKYGKTTMCAALALDDALFGDYDAQAYISSNTYNQSTICFEMVKEIVKMLDKGPVSHFKVRRDSIHVRFKPSRTYPGRASLVRCLPYSPDKLDGLKASTGIYDEFAQADSADQKNVIASSMGTRTEPLTIDITTASAKIDTPFVEELEAYKRILRGEAEGDNVFAHLFEPDLEDDEFSESTWAKVNPHYGVTVQPSFYYEHRDEAQRGFDNLKEFRTKLLNKFVFGEQKSWYDADVIYKLSRPFDWHSLNAMYGQVHGAAAVDLSVTGDMTAITYMGYVAKTGVFYSKTKYYMPEASAIDHRNAQLYRDWADKGYLTFLPGGAIDPAKIADLIMEENNENGIALHRIGFDPYKSADLVNRLKAYIGRNSDKVLSAIRQPMSNFTASVLKMGLLTDKEAIVFEENPITPWCFSNAVLAEDNNGNCKPMKRSTDSPLKIDGAITNLMCLNLMTELKV